MTAAIDCVLVHGFTGLPRSWRRVLAHLPAGRARVWLPTLPGHGASPEAVDASLAALGARWGHDLLARQDHAAWWIGYSLGARVCCAVAAAVPEAVAGLVLIGVNPGMPEADAVARDARRALEEGWAQRLRHDGLEAFNLAWAAQPLFATQGSLPQAVRAERAAIRGEHEAAPLAEALLAFGTSRMPDYHETVASMDTPVMLVTGERDVKFDAIARAWRERAPHLSHCRVADCGHDPTVERPEALAKLLSTQVPALGCDWRGRG